MSTTTNKNAVLIPEASSDRGLGVAASDRDHSDLWRAPGVLDQLVHLSQQAEVERVQSLGAVEHDREHARRGDIPERVSPLAFRNGRQAAGAPGFLGLCHRSFTCYHLALSMVVS